MQSITMGRITAETKRHLEEFLAEDVQGGDVTGALLPNGIITARIITKNRTVVAGTAHARAIFETKKSKVKITARDGTRASRNDTIMTVRGESKGILECERTALNLLSRMCGIATATADIVSVLPSGVEFYATRKTAPGLRMFDKEAVEAGGGKRHRMSLCESVMIKDNHIAAMGAHGYSPQKSIEYLIKAAKSRRHRTIEAEVESASNAIFAARAGATVIMLDNFSPARIRSVITLLEKKGLRRSIRIEASGGITKRNIASYARSGADIISAGYVTNAVPGIDLSLVV